jgi:branched-chain amino acid transport system ATP-binding protein
MGAYTIEARKKRDETLEWIYQLFPILKEREKQIAGTLSGGEQQMLTIARGLMLRPKLLMLDEPSYSLAPKLVLKIFDTLRRINEEGITILLVEQNVGHSLTLAGKAYVLESGRVTLHGAGQELLENPQVKKIILRYVGINTSMYTVGSHSRSEMICVRYPFPSSWLRPRGWP